MGQLPRPLNPHASPWAGFGAALRTLRVDRGLSQAQLGRAVHVSGDLIGKIEKAQRNPQPDIVNRLDLFLRADGRLLAAAAESTTSARGVPPVPDATAVPVVPSGLPAPLAVELLGGVRQVLAGCRRLDHALGPAAVVDTVATQLAITQAALPESRGPDRDELLSTLAQLHQFVGWMAFDRDDVRAAREAFTVATGYAQAAGDAGLLAYILGPNQGFASTYRGRPAEGVTFGGAALGWARRAANPRLTAFVLATTARAHARLGDERACLTLLGQAEDELDQCPDDEQVPDWLTVFDAAALHGHRGSCLLDLRRPNPAVDALHVQDAAAPRCFARNRVIWQIDRTRAHLNLGDLDAACAALTEALPLARATSSRRIRARIRQISSLLVPHRTYPPVAHMVEQLRGPATAAA